MVSENEKRPISNKLEMKDERFAQEDTKDIITSPPEDLRTTSSSYAISNSLHKFCSSSSRFLNEFSFIVNNRLEAISQKIEDVDVQLSLLERKIPMSDENDVETTEE